MGVFHLFLFIPPDLAAWSHFHSFPFSNCTYLLTYLHLQLSVPVRRVQREMRAPER